MTTNTSRTPSSGLFSTAPPVNTTSSSNQLSPTLMTSNTNTSTFRTATATGSHADTSDGGGGKSEEKKSSPLEHMSDASSFSSSSANTRTNTTTITSSSIEPTRRIEGRKGTQNAEKPQRGDDGAEENEERKGGREAADGATLQTLQDRLSMSEEWNRRLHHELQVLLQLPPADLQAWRERMESVEVSLPLLQRYDAMLEEKEEHIAELEGRIRQLHSEVEEYLSREQDFQQDDMLRKGLLEKVKCQAEEEVGKGKNKLRDLQQKYDDLERELRRAVETAQDEAHRASVAQEERRHAEQTFDQRAREKKDLEETVEVLRRAEQHRRATEKEEALEKEALQLQLQVLLRQREEMKKEVEQVRGKMIHGIRQAGENHAAHLRVVEERHRTALEDQRQVSRTHEMEILKLRAQLARMDPNASLIGGGGGGVGGSASPRLGTSSTTVLLESQTLQAQDNEIKRLYADLGHAQRQRDDALDRWHELSDRMDEKEKGWIEDHRREEQTLQKRLHEVRSQLDRKDGECARLQRVVSEHKERQRQLEDAVSELRQARDQLQEALAEQTKNLSEKDHILRRVQEDQDRYHGQEVERHSRLEQRVEAVLEELRQSRSKSLIDLQNVERERNTARTQLQEGRKQLVAVQQTLAQRDREKEVMEIQMSKLLEGLSRHKNELLQTDNRLVELQRGKAELERQQRLQVLAMEHLKLENTRLQRQLSHPL